MPNREEVEEIKRKRAAKQRKARQRELRRKRNLRLAIICAVFSIIVIIGAAYIIVHSISDKEKLRNAGIKAFNSGSYNEAIDKFNESLSRDMWFSKNMDMDTNLYLGAAYMRNGEYEKAYQVYAKLIGSDYNSTDISYVTIQEYANLANTLNSLKSGVITDDEVTSLKTELEHGNKSVNLFLGLCYQQRGEYDEMIKAFNEYESDYGINTYLAYQMSSYYLKSGDLENATAYINKGLSASDSLYLDKLMYNDVVVSEKNKDYSGALEKIKPLAEQYPENEAYQKEYKFLYSRVNVNTEPVNKSEE